MYRSWMDIETFIIRRTSVSPVCIRTRPYVGPCVADRLAARLGTIRDTLLSATLETSRTNRAVRSTFLASPHVSSFVFELSLEESSKSSLRLMLLCRTLRLSCVCLGRDRYVRRPSFDFRTLTVADRLAGRFGIIRRYVVSSIDDASKTHFY